MQLSSYEAYGLWVTRMLADSDKPVTRTKMAAVLGVEANFLQQIVRRLQAAGLVKSERGMYGGAKLTRPARQIRQADVLAAMAEKAVLESTAQDGRAVRRARDEMRARLAPVLDRSILEWPSPTKVFS
ncbi:MAG: Rrf2 family transcriptional regulator [Phycisphaerae bacterium]|nr:Rrf2 family transcriptional regulator [Phycisphaerae bacterium]